MSVHGRDAVSGTAQLRARVREALIRCLDADTDCEDCREWTDGACGMAKEALRLLDADEAEIIDLARKYEAAKCDNIAHLSFQPGLAQMRIRRTVRERLTEMGLRE